MHPSNIPEQYTSEPREHIDPVCGMTVFESPTALKSDYQGTTYYFCSRGCKVSFEKEPDKYLREGPQGHM